jgi:hypothetical protein
VDIEPSLHCLGGFCVGQVGPASNGKNTGIQSRVGTRLDGKRAAVVDRSHQEKDERQGKNDGDIAAVIMLETPRKTQRG